MPTAQQLITQALVDLGIYAPGETPGASESANGLVKLNIMLDNFSGARDFVYEILDSNYALTNTQSFPIGLTAAAPFNVARPIRIENAQMILTVGAKLIAHDLKIVGQAEWQTIDDKAATGTLSMVLYYDPAVPNGVLNLWPIPLCSVATSLDIGTWNTVAQFATLATNASLPPAYYRVLLLGLQMELAATYGALVSPGIMQLKMAQFQEALSVVRALNSAVQLTPLAPTPPLPGPQQAQQAQVPQ